MKNRGDEQQLNAVVTKIEKLASRLESIVRKQSAVESDLASIAARQDTTKSMLTVGAPIAMLVLVGWLGWVSVALISAKSDLAAMKQKVKDAGFGDIVTSLRTPLSNSALKHDLDVVSARAKAATLDHGRGADLNSKNISEISSAVAQAAARDPNMPEVWQAASQLITLKSVISSRVDPYQTDCFSEDPMIIGNGTSQHMSVQATLSNCILRVDDLSGWQRSRLRIAAEDSIVGNGPLEVNFRLNRVQVEYRGGRLIPVHSITCDECSFAFESVGLPPPRADQLITSLLTADLTMPINITLESPTASVN